MLKNIICLGLCSVITTTTFAGKIDQSFNKILPASEINQIVKNEPTTAVNAKYNKIIGTKMPLTLGVGTLVNSTSMKGNTISFDITIPHKVVLQYSGEDTGLYVYAHEELSGYYCKILKANPKVEISTYLYEIGKNKKKLPVSEFVSIVDDCP